MSALREDDRDELDVEESESTWKKRGQARLRQINIGKARPEYRRYCQEVPAHERSDSHPRTPDPDERVSKRQFDRSLSSWRRRLHEYGVNNGGVPTSRRASEPELATEETCIVPICLADALAAADLPPPSQVSSYVHSSSQHQQQHLLPLSSWSASIGQSQMHLVSRQLDFDGSMGGRQHGQALWSPVVPSTSMMTPLTPAPREPFPRDGRLGIRHEIETPERPSQPVRLSGDVLIGSDSKAAPQRNAWPQVALDPAAPSTPPRTPTRKLAMDVAADALDSSVRSMPRNLSPPPSVAKTPSYGNWVINTPEPQELPSYAMGHLRYNHQVSGMPPLLPHPHQPTVHHQLNAAATPWVPFGH